MERILLDHGWTLMRSKGSHASFYSPESSRGVTVPMHGSRTLRPGTQKAILKAAGISADEI